MTYPKEFSELQRAKLERIVPLLEALSPGESQVFTAATPKAAEEIKYLIYAWLSPFHSGRKAEFRLRRSGSPLRFSVDCLDATCSFTTQKISCNEHPLLSEIVGILDEDEVDEEIRSFALSPEEAAQLKDDWRKVHS